MRRLKLTVAYDGTGYHGFQRQPDQVTVQQVLEERLAKIFGERVSLTASGRTDARVHAWGQVVSFSTAGRIPVGNIVSAAKSVLPDSIAVVEAQEVADDFHARFSAVGKRYVYKIAEGKRVDPFLVNYVWLLGKELCLEGLQAASAEILGRHDFSSFQAAGSTPTSPVRVVSEAVWQREGELLVFSVTGNGFLYHMVRNLVGTLVDVGSGKSSLANFKAILAARDRRFAGKTAPPQGLYLAEVFY